MGRFTLPRACCDLPARKCLFKQPQSLLQARHSLASLGITTPTPTPTHPPACKMQGGSAAPKGDGGEAGGSGGLGKGALVALAMPGIARLVIDEEGPEPIAEVRLGSGVGCVAGSSAIAAL